jgi:biopolymer transport protein ExbD
MIKLKATFTVFVLIFLSLFAQLTAGEGSVIKYSRIHIGSEGTISLDGVMVSQKYLRMLMNEPPVAPEEVVMISADEEASADEVLKVMDICCNYKARKIRLVYAPAWNHKS